MKARGLIERLRASYGNLSIHSVIVIALTVGLIAPLGTAAVLDWQVRHSSLRSGLERDHEKITEVLAQGLTDSVWNLEPAIGKPLLATVINDPRIVAIDVTSSIVPNFLKMIEPGRRRGKSLLLERPIRYGAEEIGRVRVEMSTGPLEDEFARDRRRVLLALALQFAVSAAIILFLLRRKVVEPLRRLVLQSKQIATGELNQADVWSRRDEVGMLGRSMDEMRRSLADLFDELKRRNAELVSSETRLRTVADLHPTAMTITRLSDRRMLFANVAWRDMFGTGSLRLEEFDARRFYVDPSDRERLFASVERGEDVTDAKMELRRSDGSHIPISMTARRTMYEGSPAMVAGMMDLTALKAAETEIARQREALHQSEKLAALGSLLAGVAHELNNPMSVVLGYSSVLKEHAPDEATRERAARIHGAADRCARIVRTFLAMARQKPQSKGAVEVNQLLQATVEMLGYQLRTADVEVIWDLAPALPTVWGDSDQLSQVLINLIVNAQQALQGVPQPRRLFLRTRRDDGFVRIEVADSGPGIPEAIRPRIFDPFFTTKEVGTGTGLGLSVSRGIVLAHDGQIAADDRPEGGARLTVRLPESKALEKPETPIPRPTPDRRSAILVVDDEPDIRSLLADALASDGHRVEVAATGREAITLIDSHPYDLILSDLRMPDLDGPALYRYLKSRRSGLLSRLIFITGDVLSADIRGFLAGIDLPILEKPVDIADLRRRVRSQLAAC